MRAEVKPELLRWARERAGIEPALLARRFPKLPAWERGTACPTLRQVEQFAKATHTPVGFLFLQEPPVEQTPLPDFRTAGGTRTQRASPDLLETIYLCQQRQEWFREYARSAGEEPLAFVGSARTASDVEATAAEIRHILGFDIEERRQMPTWTDALRRFIEQAESAGILVMCSGVVLNNNRRQLDPQEFRGFTISDRMAPLIFINGADTKAAQMFTLAHELAHVWLGQSALGDEDASRVAEPNETESWCNRVAAEILAPLAVVGEVWLPGMELGAETARLARHFKVSTLVALRRLYDAGKLSRPAFRQAYAAELARVRAIPKSSGGDFYLTLGARAGKRFTRALISSALEGRSSFSEAFRLLGFRKMATFRELAQSLGMGA